jgi:hypothetical protein
MNPRDTTPENDLSDPVFEALRALPPVAASPEFRARVLARVAAGARVETVDAVVGWSRGWALFAASLVAVSAVTAWQWERRERRREWLDQVQAIRQETQSLGAELSDLRAAERAPVVYLGGDESVDLILDLEQLQQARASQQPATRVDGAGLRPMGQGETL